MVTVIIITIIILLLIIRNLYELRHLKVMKYELKSTKLRTGSLVRTVFISDLHMRSYGDKNEKLISMVSNEKPDVILLGGDMIVHMERSDEEELFDLLHRLVEIAPVFYAPGNHEIELKEQVDFASDRFEKLISVCEKLEVKWLDNKTVYLNPGLLNGPEQQHYISFHHKQPGIVKSEEASKCISPDRYVPEAEDYLNNILAGHIHEQKAVMERISITGLELPYEYYDRHIKKQITADDIKKLTERPLPENFSILLAHPPALFEEYAECGYDLVLAGHYHGGAIRFGKVGLVSPQVKFFPKYSGGIYKKQNTTMIVTRGAGSHSVNLRLFNYPEIIVLDIEGCS